MSKNSNGGSGCGWTLGFIAMIAALASIYVTGAVGLGELSKGAVGMPAESHDLAGLLVVIGIVALGMAKRENRS